MATAPTPALPVPEQSTVRPDGLGRNVLEHIGDPRRKWSVWLNLNAQRGHFAYSSAKRLMLARDAGHWRGRACSGVAGGMRCSRLVGADIRPGIIDLPGDRHWFRRTRRTGSSGIAGNAVIFLGRVFRGRSTGHNHYGAPLAWPRAKAGEN